MFDWLKFFPLSIEQDSKNRPPEIRGPYFAKPRHNQWRFNDLSLHFQAPWANPIFSIDGSGQTMEAKQPGRANILSFDIFSSKIERVYFGSDSPPNSWDLNLFYRNTWYFVGPWFSGMKERLKLSAILATAIEDSSFAESNLFHPRVFEAAVANYLDDAHGYSRSGKRPYFRGPLNWQVLPLSQSITGICCDVHYIANGGKENPNLYRLIFIPVSPHQLVKIGFDFGGCQVFHDQIRALPLLKLCDSIIKSMRLEVGPATQAEWDKVKATCPDMSLTDTFGELPWPLYKEKANKKDKERDITPNTSPKAVEFKTDE